jgi:hypothetical protein
MLVDRKTGKALVVALWQTEADHKATSGPYLRSQFDKFMALFVEPPIEELNEVAAEGWPYRLRCSVSPSPTLRPSGLTNRWSERS